jgi:mRNA interferase YafQ
VAVGDEPQPRTIVRSKQYDRDAAKARKRGLDLARLVAVVDDLRHRRPLATRLRDHALAGTWKGYRECHVQPDWLLIYRVDEEAVYLARTGTHADLFE